MKPKRLRLPRKYGDKSLAELKLGELIDAYNALADRLVRLSKTMKLPRYALAQRKRILRSLHHLVEAGNEFAKAFSKEVRKAKKGRSATQKRIRRR
jgi:hypothetical protein